MIVGICGLIGSGKGTVADVLVRDYDFKKISFADKLKDGVSVIFGWDRDMLEGETPESREWREQIDEFWRKETGEQITPRRILQLFGTDCMRNGFYDGVWVSLVKKEIMEHPEQHYVIPDVRFDNEMKLVKDLGGELIWVRRGELPEWWDTALITNYARENEEYIIYDEGRHMEVAYPDVHPSEWKWARTDDEFDLIITNYGRIEELQEKVHEYILNH